MIENQQNHRADNRHEQTVEVESAYTTSSKDVEQPATSKSADNTQQDVEQNALTSPIYMRCVLLSWIIFSPLSQL